MEWTIDELRNIEDALGRRRRELGSREGSDIGRALVLDSEALKNHLASASLATLLGLSTEYEDACGYDGMSQSHAASPEMFAMKNMSVSVSTPTPTSPTCVPSGPTEPVEPSAPPAVISTNAAADDWLDELLDES